MSTVSAEAPFEKLHARSEAGQPGDTETKWILELDPAREWLVRRVEVQAPPVLVGPVRVYVRAGMHPAHLATALRALADHVETTNAGGTQ